MPIAALTAATSAQSTTRSFYSSGQSVGRATTQGNTTTIYDACGRTVGRSTTNR